MRNYFSLNSIGLVAVLFFSFSAKAVPLTGTKTIGGTTPDYATFTDAVTDLNANGVGTGGVTFNIRSGTYSGNVTITTTGTLASPIVFQSENLDAATVTISSGGSADVITLQGASYLTLRALTIDYTSTTTYSAIEVTDNSDFVTITNCILDGSGITSTTYASSVIYASETLAANDCEGFVVSSCTIRNGSYGICFDWSNSIQPSGIILHNNRFENGYAGGMYLQDLSTVTVSGNTVTTTQTGNSSYYGIYLNGCHGEHAITGNYIYTSGTGEIGYGTYLTSSSSSQGNNALMANNSIQISNTASIAIGIDQNNSLYWDIFSNTVYVAGGTSSSTFAYRTFSFSDDTKIKNNIFANFAAGTGISSNQTVYIANATGVSEASHNCYWTANTGNPFRANYSGSYTSLATYTAAIGETNAVNIDPQMTFVSGKGWKATNPSLVGAGLYFANIPTDIDGNTRLNPTTIGAHEITASTNPPANDNICSATTLNFGTTVYTNVDATAEVNEPVPSIADCSTGWCAADGAVQNSVWFTFTITQTKKVSISTTGFDSQIAVYSASSCSTAFTIVTANDNSGSAAEITSACLAPGTYFLHVDGFQGASGSGNITLNELALDTPTANAATNASCTSFTANWSSASGAIAYFIDVATDSAFSNYVSGFNNYNAGNVTSLNVTSLTEETTYYYRVRADDGCSVSGNSNIISALTLSLPEANFSFSVNGFTVSFSNTSTSAVSYQWNFGDSNTSAIANPTHTYSSLGNNIVQLIATNTCGSDTISQNVNLNCNSIIVSITANGNTTFCAGDSVELTTTPVAGYSYQWLKNGQVINGAENDNYNASESGDYTLSVTDSNSCPGNSDTIAVLVNDLPAVTLAAFDTACTTDAVFNVSGGFPAGGIYLVNGTAMTQFNPATGADVYIVEYIYTDADNCAASASENLVVDVCSGVKILSSEFMRITPNPVADFLTIKFIEGALSEPAEIILYDAQGKIALRSALQNAEEYVNVKQLDAGIYLVKILSESKILYEDKVSVLR